MNEDTIDHTDLAPERPTFLTVLCILTFIGSGLGVLGGLLMIVGSSALATFTAAGGSVLYSILSLLASALCLFGAIQMWNLKKQGFMLYVAGCAVSIILGLVQVLTYSGLDLDTTGMTAQQKEILASSGDVGSAAMWGGFIFGLAITIAFILMYNANRKHLVY